MEAAKVSRARNIRTGPRLTTPGKKRKQKASQIFSTHKLLQTFDSLPHYVFLRTGPRRTTPGRRRKQKAAQSFSTHKSLHLFASLPHYVLVGAKTGKDLGA